MSLNNVILENKPLLETSEKLKLIICNLQDIKSIERLNYILLNSKDSREFRNIINTLYLNYRNLLDLGENLDETIEIIENERLANELRSQSRGLNKHENIQLMINIVTLDLAKNLKDKIKTQSMTMKLA